jgi:hypothetical protein
VSPAGEIAWSGVAALGANGDAVAVYFQPGGTGPVVRAALRGHDGTWAAPTTLSAPAGASGLLQAGVDAAGTAVVAWEQWGAGLGDVVVQAAVRPPGGPFEPAADVAPGGIDPQLAVDAAGDSVLTWIGVDANGDIGTFGAIRPAGGAFSAGRLITPADVEATNWGLGIDGAGDALVVWLDADTNGVRATPYDATPPLLADVTVPATAVAGAAVPMAASASDAWSATSLSFDFGDGATGHGPSVTHAYAAPGDYHVRVTATDEAGNTSVATRDIAVAPAPVADTRPQPKPATPTPTPPAPSGGAAKTPPPAVVLAAKLTAAALAKGAPSTLSGLAAGSKVKMQILAGKKVVGRASATADKAGRAKLKLKLARKLAKQLRHKRLTVRYTLTAADGSTRVLTKHLKVG